MPRIDPLRDALNSVVTKSTWRADNTVLIHDGTAWNTLVGRIVMATNGEREAEAVAAYAARLREAVEAEPSSVTQHTCWDNHAGPDGTHADGSECHDKPIESVHRTAIMRLIDEASEEVNAHGYTCGHCLWGRDVLKSKADYDIHVAETGHAGEPRDATD